MSVLEHLDVVGLGDWLVEQRWFASKSREVGALRVLEEIELGEDLEPRLLLAIVEVRFHAGTHELYQVPLGMRHVDEGWSEAVIAEVGDRTVYDAMADPECVFRLARALRDGTRLEREDATWGFHAANGLPDDERLRQVRPVGVEQSNSSVVFAEELILKVYRRVEPGPNPELELLRFLTEHGFDCIARLAGWYDHMGRLVDATLGLMQEFLPGGSDGWELALAGFEADRGEAFLGELATLGEITARMHSTLGSDANDPTFAPEEPSSEAISLLLATIDEEIEAIFRDLPAEGEDLDPIRGRGQEVREQLRGLAHAGAGGRVIRCHGDYHLGQCIRSPRGWVVLDFEGEPARTLPQRRQKRSPLRDVAGMLRSFAYAASAAEILRGEPAPADWEERARAAFLDAYLAAVDSRLLPHGQQNTARMLQIFELEKAVYELRYELNNRPDWVRIPVAGIARLLEVTEP
ncbi:MAG TPA: phosphotransferase [Solirubrobacteraceae bacterium]|nr:phosphotransferase [Solirubrobacteraceae bacterium]